MTPETITEILAKGNAPLIAGHNAEPGRVRPSLPPAEWSALRRYIDSTKKVGAA